MRIRAKQLSWRRVDGEVVALDLATGTYYAANSSASALWELLCEGCDRAGLIGALVTEYGIPEEDAARDVDAFLDELERQALLEPAAARAVG